MEYNVILYVVDYIYVMYSIIIYNISCFIYKLYFISYICIIFHYIHTVEYYSAIKEKEILLFLTTWMHPEDSMLNEIRLTRQILYTLTYI